MTNNQQQAEPPISEGQRIRDRKRKVIDTLQDKFYQPVWRERLMKICGQDESRIMKALNSFITYIMNDDGGKEDRKAYIADCTLASISTAFLEAFQMGIEVGGGRDHAYLVNYAGQCDLDISYKGFVFALNKHFDNAFVDARCVFEGDSFECEITDMTATYTHKPKDAFAQTWDKMRGCFCYFSYTLRDGGGKVSRLIMIPRGADAKTPDSLEMIRSKAKGSWAWKDFPFEQSKKSTIRRAAKIPFAAIDFGDEDVNPETVDNRHFQIEGEGSGNKLQLMMDKHREMLEDEKPDEPKKDGKPAQGAAGASAGADEAGAKGADDQPQGQQHPAADPAAGAVASEAGEISLEENERRFAEISEDDFGKDDGKTIEHAPVGDPAGQVIEGKAVDVTPGATVWDGQTLIIGGKSQAKDFASSLQAKVYLQKVLSQRKHKASRLAIIAENPLLIAALIKDGQGNAVTELHQLADKGE
jgi:recombinational DNA repair protein RecT